MQELIDAVFQTFGWILGAPILLLMIAVSFGIMSGQKPERAVKWAFNCLLRIVKGIFKLLFRAVSGAFKGGRTARSNYRHGGTHGGASDDADDLYRPKTGNRNRGRNNPRTS